MTQRGSALIYILIAIALLGALTISLVEPSGQQSRSQNSYRVAMELKAQAELYRAAIQDCILTYPAGDVSNPTKYAGYNEPYPLTPNSSYLTAPAPSEAASGIRCPGNPGDSTDHSLIFGGTTGRFAPVAPSLMEPWQYYNDSDGVYLLAHTYKTDLYLQEGMQKAAAMLDPCESEYSSGAAAPCYASAYCWRVWVIRNTSCP